MTVTVVYVDPVHAAGLAGYFHFSGITPLHLRAGAVKLHKKTNKIGTVVYQLAWLLKRRYSIFY